MENKNEENSVYKEEEQVNLEEFKDIEKTQVENQSEIKSETTSEEGQSVENATEVKADVADETPLTIVKGENEEPIAGEVTNETISEQAKAKQVKKEKKKKEKIERPLREINFWDFFYPLVFIGFYFVTNIIGYLWLGMPIFPKYFLLDFGIVLAFALGIFLLPTQKGRKIATYIILLLVLVIQAVNACVYKVFGDVFHLRMFALIQETASVLDLSYFNIPSIIVYLGILGMLIFVSKFFSDRMKKAGQYYSRPKYHKILCIGLATLLPVAGFFGIAKAQISNSVNAESAQEEFNITNDETLYNDLMFKYNALSKFGFFGFYTKEAVNVLFGANLNLSNKQEAEFIELLQSEHNNYTDTTNKGLLADQNLILVLTESLEWGAIDPIYTPTLYNLYFNEGVTLTNYFSKNKTNVSEGIVNFGAMPSSFMLAGKHNGKTLTAPYALASMFGDRGYKSDYFHSFLHYYYDRNQIMPAIGYENLYFADQTPMDYKVSSFQSIGSDLMFFNAVKDEMIKADEKFFSSYATTSTHSTYNDAKKSLSEFYDLFDDQDKYAQFKDYMRQNHSFDLDEISKEKKNLFLNYKVGAIDLDQTIAAMIEDIEAKGIADKTTLILFSDHNAYGNNMGYMLKDLSPKDYYKTEPYRIPATIYSPSLEGQIIDVFTNPYDLYKTICVLFGLDVNSAVCNGYNIFDPQIENSFFVSFTSGIITKDLFSRDYDTVYSAVDGSVCKDQAKVDAFIQNINEFYYKQMMVEKMYMNNIFYGYEIVNNGTTTALVKA